MGTPTKDRQAAFVKRRAEKGIIRVCDWVPLGDKQAVKDLCKKLRDAKSS